MDTIGYSRVILESDASIVGECSGGAFLLLKETGEPIYTGAFALQSQRIDVCEATAMLYGLQCASQMGIPVEVCYTDSEVLLKAAMKLSGKENLEFRAVVRKLKRQLGGARLFWKEFPPNHEAHVLARRMANRWILTPSSSIE